MAAHIDSEPMPGNNSPIVEVEVASHSSNNSNSTQNLNSNQQLHPNQNLIESKVKTSENMADSKNMVVLNPVLQKGSRDQSEPESVIQRSHLTDRNAAPRDIVLTEVKISEGPFTYATTNFQS